MTNLNTVQNSKSPTQMNRSAQIATDNDQQKTFEQQQTALVYLRKILLSSVYQVAIETELTLMTKLSTSLNHNIYLKREDQQKVQSFKIRGAFNKLDNLLKQQQNQQSIKEVVASSAGNHAQGLALAAKYLGISATIFMPITTPEIKVDNVRLLGANVKLVGKNFDQAQQESLAYATKHDLEIIHPFDDMDVIAGQGTIGKEILQQQPNSDVIFVPVGGGGLLAGIAVYIKQLNPNIKVIGVEAEDSACLKAAVNNGQPTDLEQVGLFADGVAVKRIGIKTFELIKHYCDEVITVSSDEICSSIKDIFEQTRVIAEPAGALSLAGLKKYCLEHKTEVPLNLIAILSGANMSFHNLRYVSERCELGEKKEAILAVSIEEKKGSFLRFCKNLGGRSITEFNYRYANNQSNQNSKANIFVGVRLSNNLNERQSLIEHLTQANYAVEDFTENELAKLHVRHMVGGSNASLKNERIFRFEFPEYPGALENFLSTLGELWNITLFHYRNHGAAYGQVLAGFEVSDDQQLEFFRHLKELDYDWQEETQNRAYQGFLA